MDTFNEPRARELINSLLSNDSRAFRNKIPEVEKFTRQELILLFQGNLSEKINNSQINPLLRKFEVFSVVLCAWYTQIDKEKYLQELWSYYPDLNKYRTGTINELETSLVSCGVKFNEWPEKIKTEFYNLIKIEVDENKIISLIKDRVEKDQIFMELLAMFNSLESEFDNIEDKDIKKKLNLVRSGSFIQMCSDKIDEIIFGDNSITGLEPLKIRTKIFNFFSKKTKELIISLLKEKGKSLAKKITLKFLEKIQENFNNMLMSARIAKGLLLGLSCINFCSSTYNLVRILDESVKLEQYKIRFYTIKKNVSMHINIDGDLPTDSFEIINLLWKLKTLIMKDKRDLSKLIEEIKEDLKKTEDVKNDSIKGVISSILLGGINIAMCYYSSDFSSIFSTVIDGISTAENITTIAKAVKIASEFQNVLNESYKLEKTIDEILAKTMNKIYNKK